MPLAATRASTLSAYVAIIPGVVPTSPPSSLIPLSADSFSNEALPSECKSSRSQMRVCLMSVIVETIDHQS